MEKIKIVKLEEKHLIRFTLASDEGTKGNCLIRLNALNFLYQIVVKKYHVKEAQSI